MDISSCSIDELNNGILDTIRSVSSSPYQTVEIVNSFKLESKKRPWIVLAQEQGKLLGYCLVYFRDIIISIPTVPTLTQAYVNGGPVLIDDEANKGLTQETHSLITKLIIEVVKISRQNRVDILKWQPRAYWGNLLDNYFLSSGFTKSLFCTYLVDLQESIESIFEHRIDKKKRHAIKRAIKLGVSVVEANSKEEINIFAEIAKEMWQRERIAIDESYERNVFSLLQTGKAKLFLAMHDDEVIAGRLIVFNDAEKEDFRIGIDHSAASNHKGYRMDANSLVVWNILAWLNKENYRYFDFNGCSCVPETGTKEYSIRFFKSEWGGLLLETPVYNCYPTVRSRIMNQVLLLMKRSGLSYHVPFGIRGSFPGE